MDSNPIWQRSLEQTQDVLETFRNDPEQMKRCAQFSQMLTRTLRSGGHIFACGNGGSHCDAMHFAEELTGRYRKNRRPLGALALGDASHTSCVANDYGFDYVFSRQLEALARPGDLLLALSTSGHSRNIIEAVGVAKKIGFSTVGLLGRTGGPLKELVDLALVIPAETSDRIQEMHIKLIHIAIECVERELFPENY